MEMKNQIRLNKNIFRLLKVNEIIYPIGRTNKGNLGIKFNESSDDFEIYLDAVPLSIKDWDKDENNIELKKLIEKYWFDGRIINGSQFRGTYLESKGPFIERISSVEDVDMISDKENLDKAGITQLIPKKPHGRPKGSVNKK